jgi:DNA-binding NtrC family response regulator
MTRILIVDDDANVRSMLREILGDAEFEVAEAADGAKGLRTLRQQRADVVLCDLFMPVADGFEMIREMQREFPDVKIVAMSGGGFGGKVDMLPMAKHFGVAEILYKPFDAADVLATIRRVLAVPAKS